MTNRTAQPKKGKAEAAAYERAPWMVENASVFGLCRKNGNFYGWYVYYHESLPADLLPGFELGQYTGEVLEGMADLARLYRLTGQDEKAMTLEEALARIISNAAGSGQEEP